MVAFHATRDTPYSATTSGNRTSGIYQTNMGDIMTYKTLIRKISICPFHLINKHLKMAKGFRKALLKALSLEEDHVSDK